MPVAREEVELAYKANLEQLTKQLGELPGITSAEAKKMVKELDKSVRSAEAASKRASSAAQKQWEKDLKDIKKLGQATFGGIVNDIEDVVEGVGALGPAGIAGAALVGFAGIAVAAGAGMVGLVEKSHELVETLKPLSDQEGFGFTEDQVATIQGAHDNMTALGAIVDQIEGTLGAEFAPVVEEVTGDLVQLGLAGLDIVENYTSANDVLHDVAVFAGDTLLQAILAPITGVAQLTELVGDLGEAVGLQDNIAKRAGDAYDGLTHSLAEWAVGTVDVTGHLDELADRYGVSQGRAMELARATEKLNEKHKDEAGKVKDVKDALDALNKAYGDVTKGGDEMAAVSKDARNDLEDAEAKARDAAMERKQQLQQGYNDEIAGLKKLGASQEEFLQADADFAQGRQDIEERLQRDIAGIRDKARADYEERQKKAHDDEMQRLEQEKEKQQEITRAVGDAYSSLAGSIHDVLQAQIDQAEGGTEAQKRAAMTSFRVDQGLSAVQIAMATAVGIAKAFELGPIAGPIAAAAIGAEGLIQEAEVVGQKPPSFGVGGIIPPDHRLIGVKPETEAVLESRGVDAFGGPDAVRRANMGMSPGGTTRVQVVYRHKVYDDVTQDNLDRGDGPLSREFARNRRDGQNRRRS